MAKPQRKSKGGRGQGAVIGGKSRRGRPDPIKSMLLGAIIIGALCLFFLWRVKGDTPFNHLMHALGGASTGETASPPSTPPSAPQSHAEPATPARAKPIVTARAETPRPRPTVSPEAHRTAPMERVSAADEAALDRLIQTRAQ